MAPEAAIEEFCSLASEAMTQPHAPGAGKAGSEEEAVPSPSSGLSQQSTRPGGSCSSSSS